MKTLRSQIYIGVVIIVGLQLTIGLISYLGSKRLAGSTYAMRDVSNFNSSVLHIVRDVQEIQMWSEKYVASGHESIHDSVQQVYYRMSSLVASIHQHQLDPGMRESLKKISRHLQEYKTQFDFAAEERRLRSDLVQDSLPEKSKIIASELAALQQQSDSSEGTSITSREKIARCESLFWQSEQLMLRYYASPASMIVNNAMDKLNQAIATAEDTNKEQENELSQALIDYRKLTLRTVQAIRGYLYLVNVVMAGEASEMTYYAERLRELSTSKRVAIAENTTETFSRTPRVIAGSLLVAMLLALMMAGRSVVLVLRPISSLTVTFRKLATGESLVQIPETSRDDEIGQMAKAAQIFSDQNETTKMLLGQSERLSERLHRQTIQLEASNQELDSFVYVASHDLKSPLRGIRQLADWIEEDSGHLLPENSVHHLQLMSSRVAKMESLLQGLLEFSRAGQQPIAPEEVELTAMLYDIIEMSDNPDEMTVHWAEGLPAIVTVKQQLEQILLNLIGNAIKYNDKGKSGIVNIIVAEEGDWLRFQVKDNGPGIDDSNKERAFEMFQRVGNMEVEGSGMGLAIVKKHVESVGGAVELTPNLTGGSIFEFTWPVSMANTEQENSHA